MSNEIVQKLAYNILALKEMELGKLDEDIISELRKRLVMELGNSFLRQLYCLREAWNI
ncbi:hypothetical protein Gogos_004690 [Gossypium gossypioides]|uniref:Uncharacterized protein n=1 Tax=Gossypium gossypioides TaxID=34282 RepID=A0A7J9CI52_GOSGO|nr:hypothetical protein [Gossypium gossypioides]